MVRIKAEAVPDDTVMISVVSKVIGPYSRKMAKAATL
jgi:hypothetical protein